MTGLFLLSLTMSPTAQACGGFFCSNEPMDQSAERIVFAIDDQASTVEMHVQVMYAGSAEKFAWVVPVPEVPEIGLSTDDLFMNLSERFRPVFTPNIIEEGTCGWGSGSYYSDALAEDGGYSSSSDGSAPGGVTVVDEGEVGPYETVTLQATSSELLVDWLQENDYDLPDALDPVLAPYVADGSYFVALRLQAKESVGALQPLSLTWSGTQATIPIQLTSVAATPDMRLEAYVLGAHRAVPDNYLHVRINDAAIDWFSAWWDPGYERAITWAADEAGGQAFATDYAGVTERMHHVLYPERGIDTGDLAKLTDVVDFLDWVRNYLNSSTTLYNLLTEYVPPPRGVDAADFYNWTESYTDMLDDYTFDPVATAEALEERIVAPAREANQLFFDHAKITRLTSSISPVEMTLDPIFVYNPDMSDVSGEWEADLYWMCKDGSTWYEANRRIELPDGRVMIVPSEKWLDDHDYTYADLLERITDHYAKSIERTGSVGEAEVVWTLGADDGLGEIDDFEFDLDGYNNGDVAGCGCTTMEPASWAPLSLLCLALIRRRRDNA
jgi:hypothetical protein